MVVTPAIDLKEGRCVRLFKGDFATVHKVADDPVKVAAAFQKSGAEIIHVVDLDGALHQGKRNLDIVREIVSGVSCKIEMGGGLRSMEELERVSDLGVWRMIIGSAAVEDPQFVREAVSRYGDRIAVGIDAKDGKVSTAGWTEQSDIDYITFAQRMEDLDVHTIIFTDIDRDGMLSGPSMLRLQALKSAVRCKVIASGGVASNKDVLMLKKLGLDGAIIGKALYTGDVDLRRAIEECG